MEIFDILVYFKQCKVSGVWKEYERTSELENMGYLFFVLGFLLINGVNPKQEVYYFICLLFSVPRKAQHSSKYIFNL